MSRRAPKRGADAGGNSIDRSGEAMLQSTDGAGALLAADPDRTARLMRFESRSVDRAVAAEVRTSVVLLVLRVPFVSVRSDCQMLSDLYQYAVHCALARGAFDPVRDLEDTMLEVYGRRFANPASASTHVSRLRRVRSATPRPLKGSRSVAKAPYTSAEWRRLWDAAGSSSVESAQVLLALLGWAGMRPGEAERAERSMVIVGEDRVSVLAVETAGTFRVIPLGWEAGRVVRERAAGADGYLVRSGRTARENVVNVVLHAMRRESSQFAHIDAQRLRHTAVARWLLAPLPFTVVCAVAGINGQSHLSNDIRRHLPVPDDAAVAAAFDAIGEIR